MSAKEQFRKVFVPVATEHGPTREYLWAIKVTEDTAKINNIPHFSDKVGYDDLVRVSESGEVLEVLEQFTRTRHATYDSAPDRQDAERQWREIGEHFKQLGVECESAQPGMFSMAVPKDVTDTDLQDLAEKCPIPLTAGPLNLNRPRPRKGTA